VLVVGSALAWRGPLRPGTAARPAAVSIACIVSFLAFLAIAGSSRVVRLGTSYATTSRYLHIYGALLMVPLAIAAEALVRRWRVLFVPLIVLFLVGIPGNVSAFVHDQRRLADASNQYREAILWMAKLPEARQLPAATQPEPVYAAKLTMGWLLASARQGKVPPPDPHALAARRFAQSRLDAVARAVAAFQRVCRANPKLCAKHG
jgi:hypothetical protein